MRSFTSARPALPVPAHTLLYLMNEAKTGCDAAVRRLCAGGRNSAAPSESSAENAAQVGRSLIKDCRGIADPEIVEARERLAESLATLELVL